MAATPDPSTPIVDIIYAGGTISSVTTDEGFREGGHAFHLTALQDNPMDQIGQEEVAFAGLSENITSAVWQTIDEKVAAAIARKPHGILVTHGTDTMRQTAQHLVQKFGASLSSNKIRLIMTGAHEDMYHPKTDVWRNLDYALQQAAGDGPAGVYLAYHDRLIPADEIITLPFVPGNQPTLISKTSPEYKESLAQQQAITDKQVKALIASYGHQPDEAVAVEYEANIIRDNHQDFLNYILAHPAIKAVLLNLYHSGTANTAQPPQSVAELVQALRSTRKDLVFFGVTENGEPVDLRGYETSIKLRKAGVVPLYTMLREVALTKLRLLPSDLGPQARIKAMLENKVGEIDEGSINEADIDQLLELYAA